ncbi:MAG: CPBP family intramembrane glutamic endopeptidase [Myxococcota bacterium]|nr:CPBP family intramembrane glutamic endopeptidase [Myxococcota bacterium]
MLMKLSVIGQRLTSTFLPDERQGDGSFGLFEAGLLVVVAVGLTLIQFVGSEMTFMAWYGEMLAPGAHAYLEKTAPELAAFAGPKDHPYYELFGLLHWVLFCILGFVVLPVLYLKMTGRRVGDMYLGFSGFRRHARIYFVLYILVMIPVVAVSYSAEYQQIYPFYPHADRSFFDLLAWELAYGLQFFALEFMFRGFMLAGLRKWLGIGAIFVMILPYCMLHFQKTGSESLGAIIAGILLGGLAMRYRSIWGGVFLHWLVAISMDVLSLAHQGRLPRSLFGP